MHYRREIDGLRAVAVLPVILFHAGFGIFSGGYVGVDVFFVISGYLITSILIAELELGEFSLARFYERRARRILPALFVVMLACIPFAWMWMLPSQMKDFSQSLIAVVFFASNVLFWSEEGYFAAAAELKPMLHTWSLAVEEQYYLLFPIFLFLLWRIGRDRVLWSVIAIAVASLLLSEWGWRHDPSANFYLAPTRVWEILAGSICSFLAQGKAQRSNNFLSALGLVLILFSIFFYDESTPFPSYFTLAPVVGTALIVVFAEYRTWVARILSASPFVGVGLISYSAYLWHQPLFAFARIRTETEPEQLLMISLSIASIGLAYLSWRFVELPFRRRPFPVLPRRSRLFGISGFVGFAFVFFGLLGHFDEGYRTRFQPPEFVTKGEFALAKLDNGFCFYSINNMTNLRIGEEGLNCYLTRQGDRRVLLFGDSFGAQWEPFWRQFGQENNVSVHAVTTNWCFPSFNDDFPGILTSRAFPQCIFNRSYLRENANEYDVIVLAAQWETVSQRGFQDDVFSVVDYLTDHTSAKVVLMASPRPLKKSDVRNFIYSQREILTPEKDREIFVDAFERVLMARYRDNANVTILNKADLFGNYFSSNGLLTSDGYPYSLDGSHISIYGSLASYRHLVEFDQNTRLMNFIGEKRIESTERIVLP